MARKNPLGKLVDTAVDALKNPVGTAGKVVGTARGTASLGKLAAEQVTKAAASTAFGAAGAVAERAGVRKPSARTTESAPEPTSPADLRPVPSVNEPAHPPVDQGSQAARTASTTASKAPAKRADGSAPAGKKAAATKAPAAKAPATKAPAKKAPAKKAPAKKAAKSTTARVSPASPEPSAVPDRRAAEPASDRQEQALSPNPEEVAKKAAARGAAANEAPAKRAAASKTVKQAPAKTAAKKAPAKKGAAKKAPAKKSAAKVAESRDVSPVAEDETVWSTSTPGDKLPAGRGKRNEADPEVPVTKEDREAAREATPADVAERVEGD